MATNGASMNPIFERLNSAPQHHPMNADTFSDWSMEAGDTVTVTRDGQEYSTPIHSSTMTWKGGAPMVRVNSTGNEKREAVAKMSKRKYSGGGGGMGNDQGLYSAVFDEDGYLRSVIDQTEEYIRTEVRDAKSETYSVIMQTSTGIYTEISNTKSDTFSTIEQTASSIRSEVNSSKSTLWSSIMQTATNIYTQVGNAKSGIFTQIEVTASSIRSEVSTAKSSLWSSITQTSTQISLKVGKGEVISAINMSSESIKISASKILLDGQTIADAISATNISCADITCGNINAQSLTSDNAVKGATGQFEDVYTDSLDIDDSSFSLDGKTVTWKDAEVTKITSWGASHYFMYSQSSGGTTPSGTFYGRLVTGTSTTTIHYLGRS